MRYLIVIVGCIALFASCEELKMPSEEEMTEVFATHRSVELNEPAAPSSIPILATGELADWHALCDQCHVGPNYSSFTILNWGHLGSCIAEMSCNDCHADELHLTHVRGDKASCIDCHLGNEVEQTCETCHALDWRDQHTAHAPGRDNAHKLLVDWNQVDCLVCHGSKNWCDSCHGIEMPHPEDINIAHPGLIKGQPEMCANCHGTQSCEVCHSERGISLN